MYASFATVSKTSRTRKLRARPAWPQKPQLSSRWAGTACADDDGRAASRADQGAVGDHLDALPGDPPFLGDVGGASLALAGQRLVAERIEVKRHWAECRVRPRTHSGTVEGER